MTPQAEILRAAAEALFAEVPKARTVNDLAREYGRPFAEIIAERAGLSVSDAELAFEDAGLYFLVRTDDGTLEIRRPTA